MANVVVLAGGVGAARFLEGVVQVVPPGDVTAVVNTGDDMTLHGLRISPDLDIVTCTLADVIDREQGWGIAGDTTECMQWLTRLGAPDWFKLGDRDLALHIRRTALLAEGRTLSEVADSFRRALGVATRILPMSDDPIETHIRIPEGLIHFEEYFVQRRGQAEVLGVEYAGAASASPAPGVVEVIRSAGAVLIAPSNPIVSVGTILAVPGVREALEGTDAPVVAVSPIVGGQAIKGPAAPLMRASGFEVSAAGVARCYAGIVDGMVIDSVDEGLASDIAGTGLRVSVTDTIMRDSARKRALAQAALDLARELGGRV